MKKLLSIILSILIIIPSSVALAADGYEPVVDIGDACQFAKELKEMNGESYDSSLRLIITSSKPIDYLDAVDVATGIDNLYVVQFDNEESVKNAEEYYNSLSYVEYVEYDYEDENMVCEVDDDFDFFPQCVSTVNSNIDDAIKLMHKEDIEMSEIKIGIIDTGVAVTSFTDNRVDGGYSFVDGYSEDGTDDKDGHGTKVAGTIIQNTLDNVRLYSYQIFDKNRNSSISKAVSAIYLAVTDNCKIINCSFIFKPNYVSKTIIEAVDYATAKGVFVICGAGNDSENLDGTQYYYPAIIENAFTVGALDSNKRIASSSNFGKSVDIYATGTNMTSYDNSGKKVTDWSGTSAATPVVSSICALLVLTKPNITVDEIKQILLETGQSTNEENQNDNHRVIADAYECIKNLTSSSLEQVQFDYTINDNEISFSCKDENSTIYYCNNLGGTLEIPYKESSNDLFFKCNAGETVTLPKYHILIVCAYAPNKAKKIEYLQLPIYDYESGYLLKSASATQEYNIISRCQLINEKNIEVPQYINGIEIQAIGDYCFMGNPTVETIILPKSVKQIGRYAFTNCPNLKTVIAPGVDACGRYAFYQCDNLINVEMPNVTVANTGVFKNCKSLETAKLGALTEIDNHAFYDCENLKLVKTTDDDISFAVNTFKDCDNLTISTPDNSTMAKFAENNKIPLLGEVEANGGSIRITDAGLRFGYQYNGEENKNIEEYGFVYNSGKTNDLTVDNSLKLVANNRIDHGDYTTYNLVFTSVPYTDKAFNQMISAKAYIKIGGEYFYSDTITHSYYSIADAVLKDDEIDQTTKDRIQSILNNIA